MAIGAMERVADTLDVHTGILRGLVEAQGDGGGGRRAVAGPWRDGGEYLAALRRAEVERQTDSRLMINAITTYGGESVGAAGGFAMPDQFGPEVLLPATGSGSLLAAFNPMPATSGLVRLAIDETAEWGAGGVTVTVVREGDTITATKGVLKRVNVLLVKVPALVHVSDDLIADSPGYARYVWAAMGRKIRNAVEAFIVSGTGQDQPLGLLNSPALVTVSKEAAQSASTIVAANVSKMIARLLPRSFPQAIWIAHTSALPQVAGLGAGIFNPSGNGPYGTILGRPLYVSEAANVLGQVGDLCLVDPTGYFYAVRGPSNSATTEFAFDQGLSSFRASLRMGGVPLLSAPVTRRIGTDTLSHVVVLEAR
jgi:HK97 family phage major capsid protein